MLKRSLLVLLGVFCLHTSQAQLLNKLKKLNQSKTTTTTTNPLSSITETDAASAIKEALANGVSAGIQKLNKTDGFFGSELYKMLLPDDAVKIGNTLRQLGMGKLVDNAILQINRSAEKAMGFAAPIFVDAIKQMTLTDALNLVKGGNTSATEYFKSKTTDKLKAAFAPVIKGSLDSTMATKYYGDLITSYNKLPTTFNKVNPDLQDFVTTRAVNALFDQIGKEEMNIRANPVARTTDILKKVFGAK